jgi:hypothetical protein
MKIYDFKKKYNPCPVPVRKLFIKSQDNLKMKREEALKECEALGTLIFSDSRNYIEERTEAARKYWKVIGYLKGPNDDD